MGDLTSSAPAESSQVSAAAASAPPARGIDVAGEEARSAGATGGSASRADGEPDPSNPGSRGHPNLCCRPCLHVAAAQCQSGEACMFCHLPHAKQKHRLDRRHREDLRTMPAEHAYQLLAMIIRDKLAEVGHEGARGPQFQRLLLACAASPDVGLQSLPSRPDRQLIRGLRSMSLTHLLAVLEDLATRNGSADVAAAAADLVESLLADLS